MMKILKKKVFYDELKRKPFIFSIEMETYYFYIRTVDDDLKVYCFDENEEKIRILEWILMNIWLI